MPQRFISSTQEHSPLMLASVATLDEAQLALAGGAEVIDIKDAMQGSLGAASLEQSRQIVQSLSSRVPLSATIGDLPMQAELLVRAYEERAALGVSYVKLGLSPSAYRESCIKALGEASHQHSARLVAVLFADQEFPSSSLLHQVAHAGFAGVVLDTFDKQQGLIAHARAWRHADALSSLQSIVKVAQAAGLFIGLAGSLSLKDIAPLCELKPSLLGFRGALCAHHSRIASLELARVRAVREAIDSACVSA
jgi:dihydroneopterin aldolase